MRRALAALLLFIGCTWSAAPAQAHHVGGPDAFIDTGPYDAALWNQSVSESICYTSEFESWGLSPAQISNVEESIQNAFTEWRINTDITKFINVTGECAGNMNFEAAYDNAQIGKSLGETVREDFCQHRGSQASSVQYEDLSWLNNQYEGLTWTCDTDDNGLIDYVVVVIDPKVNMNYCDGCNVPSNSFDFPGIMTHEAGHGYGFGIHWADDSETCPNNTNHNTMCDDGWGYFDGLGETSHRTIESHDIGEVNQNY